MVQTPAAGVLGKATERLRLRQSSYHVGQRQTAPVRQTHVDPQSSFLSRSKCISARNDSDRIALIAVCNCVHTAQLVVSAKRLIAKLHLLPIATGIIYTFDSSPLPVFL